MRYLVDPINTIRVRGGSGLSKPDTDTMHSVCTQLVAAAEKANNAKAALTRAQDLCEQTCQRLLAQVLAIQNPPPPSFTSSPPFNSVNPKLTRVNLSQQQLAQTQLAQTQLEHWQCQIAEYERKRNELQNQAQRAKLAAGKLGQVAQNYERLTEQINHARQALLRGAGIYEQTEISVKATLLNLMVATSMPPAVWIQLKLRQSPGIVPLIAPYTDELITGLSLAVSGQPQRSPVTPIAALASGIAHSIVPPTKLRVTETVPGHGELLGCPSPMPSWQGIPSATVTETLTRIGDLHPFNPTAVPGNPYSDCGDAGLPKGTIGIEKITTANENPVWVVLIPGTQNFQPGEHAFDGVTDLDLMAHRPDQVSTQVMSALELVGAAKGEPIVLIGHSLGGIAAVSLAASKEFQTKYSLGGVITAGSPTATFPAQPGIPYLHLENDEELVSNLDGKSGDEGPASEDRVTVTRRLSASNAEPDQIASKSLAGAHPITTHQRTLELALTSGNIATEQITSRLENLLTGDQSETRFFTGRRAPFGENETSWAQTN